MQDGTTPLEGAVRKDHHRVVDYLIHQCHIDISQFDEVYNNDTVFCACIVIVGVTMGGAL